MARDATPRDLWRAKRQNHCRMHYHSLAVNLCEHHPHSRAWPKNTLAHGILNVAAVFFGKLVLLRVPVRQSIVHLIISSAVIVLFVFCVFSFFLALSSSAVLLAGFSMS